jgi:hypothetical protein
MQERSRPAIVVAPRKAWSSKNTRALTIKGIAAFLLLVFATVSLHGNWPVALLWVGGGIGLWGVFDALRRRREHAIILHDVDTMTDQKFLRYAADLLHAQGYSVHAVDRALDPRVDLFLSRAGETFACRLQRQPRRVGVRVVIEVLAAQQAHRCERAMLVANQLFTYSARSLARRKGCVLIDRERLANLVTQYRQGHRVLTFHREETPGLRRRK